MNPTQCKERDWGLYYTGTYMLHETMGVVNVSASTGTFRARKTSEHMWRQVTPESLSCIWPKGRSINIYGQGIYVGRRGRQQAKRSATTSHYVTLWSEHEARSVTEETLRQLCFPAEYPSLEFAMRSLQQEECSSIAITRDLILCRSPVNVGEYKVICQGLPAGILKTEEEGYSFKGTLNDHPAGKRALVKLQKEGIVCH